MNEEHEEHDEGWVDPVWCSNWTLYDAAQEIDHEAYRRAAKQLQNEVHQDQDRFAELVRYYKWEMWTLAQRLLMAEYPFTDLENFSYHLQYFAIDGPEDPDDPNYQCPEPDVLGDAEGDVRKESDSTPSADELKDWIDGV